MVPESLQAPVYINKRWCTVRASFYVRRTRGNLTVGLSIISVSFCPKKTCMLHIDAVVVAVVQLACLVKINPELEKGNCRMTRREKDIILLGLVFFFEKSHFVLVSC